MQLHYLLSKNPVNLLSAAYKCPMFEIQDRLYLGDIHDALDVPDLVAHNIKCVINATADVPFADLPQSITKIRVPVEDNGDRSHDVPMYIALPYVVHRIQIHLNMGHAVLVHCFAGRQRSSCVLAAYLIWRYRMSVDDAVGLMRSKKRKAFFPSVNFIKTLLCWHDRCRGTISQSRPNIPKVTSYLVD